MPGRNVSLGQKYLFFSPYLTSRVGNGIEYGKKTLFPADLHGNALSTVEESIFL